MRKVLALLLTVLLLPSLLIAATESFTVDTIVEPSQGMKLVATSVVTPTTVQAFENATEDISQYGITSHTGEHTVRKLISYSNAVAGYKILLSAKAMIDASHESANNYIDFTVSAGKAEVTTDGAVNPKVASSAVVEEEGLANIEFFGTDIIVQVVSAQYNMALSGTYTGTIYFEFVSLT